MRIIKEGKLPEEKLLQGSCYTCGTVIECKIGELNLKGYDQRDHKTIYSYKCPICKGIIHFYE